MCSSQYIIRTTKIKESVLSKACIALSSLLVYYAWEMGEMQQTFLEKT